MKMDTNRNSLELLFGPDSHGGENADNNVDQMATLVGIVNVPAVMSTDLDC